MKNSAAVPSGAAEKRRDLTKLMPIIFARYLASLTVHAASSQSAPLYLGCAQSARPLPRGLPAMSLIPFAPLTHSLPFIRLFSFPIYLAQLPLARFIIALLCRSTRRVMSSRACDVSRVVATAEWSQRRSRDKVRDGEDTIASTRDARAPQNSAAAERTL